MKIIVVDALDPESVRSAKEEIKRLKTDWQRKANLCSEMVAAMLADLIEQKLSEITKTDDIINVKTHAETPRNSYKQAYATGNRVIIEGEEIAFIEFGAGVYHNQGVTNPLSDKVNFETAIGSYGKGNGTRPYWFIAKDTISRGTPAYRVINESLEEIKPQIPTLVRQVFS